MPSPRRPVGFRLGLLLFWTAGIALFKWSMIGPFRADDFVVGLAVELCFWGWLAFAAEGLERALPTRLSWVASLVFYLPFVASAAWVFSYTYFFDSAVERRFSLLDTDLGGMVFFLRDVLPARGWLILIALIGFMHTGAWLVQNRFRRPSVTLMFGVLVMGSLGTFFYASTVKRIATPLYDIVHDYRELWMTPQVHITAESTPFMPLAMLDKSDRVPTTLNTRYRKVLVFVMETMTAARLDDESKKLKQDTVFINGRAHSHLFDRYFPNNQDSRTGMLDLLGSRLIPYEAYRDADSEAYMGVAQLPSLLDPFQRFGYRTAFAVSQTGLEVIVKDLPWDTFIHLHEDEIPKLKAEKKLCFTPYEFENSCEDTALLPKIFDFIDSNEKVFLFQEFVWGHAYEYNEASGRINAEYYSTYIDQVIAHLSERGTLDETLIAITSDHGFRDKGLQDQLAVYRVPLQFYSTAFREKHNTSLLSHLDFKDLLFNEMQAGSTSIDHNDAVLIQGPTATSLLSALTDDNDFVLVKSRGDRCLLLSHKNVGQGLDGSATPTSLTAPNALMKLRDDYKRSFDARILAGH